MGNPYGQPLEREMVTQNAVQEREVIGFEVCNLKWSAMVRTEHGRRLHRLAGRGAPGERSRCREFAAPCVWQSLYSLI